MRDRFKSMKLCELCYLLCLNVTLLHGNRTKPPSGQNPPPDKIPLRPKPPSGQNPPPAKKTLRPKPPSVQNPPQTKSPLR